MKYQIHRYQLHPARALNALTANSARRGALIRWSVACINSGKAWAIADLLPFPELGQQGLDEQLQALKAGHPSAVLSSAMDLAESELRWRQQGSCLGEFLDKIDNHLLVDDLSAMTEEALVGFSRAKVKMGRSLLGETELLQQACEKFSLKWRLDFNNSLTEASFVNWYRGLTQKLKDSIEFIEDPFPYSASSWSAVQQELGVTLALDQQPGVAFNGKGFDVVVFKPSWDWCRRDELLSSEKKIVVTHAMTSEWGCYQTVFAACDLVGKLDSRVLACGLRNEGIFSKPFLQSAFGEQVPVDHLSWEPL